MNLILDGVCGQTLPIYFVQFMQGTKVRARVPIALGQTQITIAKDVVLAAGSYSVIVYSKSQSPDDQKQQQSFAFSKLVLQSDKVVEPKRFLSRILSN